MKFYVCNEMEKLRKILDELDIPWEDVSSKENDDLFWMCRTHFDYKGYSWSVIHGYGSYGGICTWDETSGGNLLEVMSNAVNKGEPIGWQLADQIWDMMQEV